MSGEPRDATIAYPGGLRARWRWGGSEQAAAVFALSEVGGSLVDLGPEVSDAPDALCRAELRVDGPAGSWTVRFASTLNDEPAAQLWDTAGQLVVKYGFHAYGIEARTGAPAWRHRFSPCSPPRGCATCCCRRSWRRSRSRPTARSPGESPTPTS